MVFSSENTLTHTNRKSVNALEKSLQESISHLRDLDLDFQELQKKCDFYEKQFLHFTGKCESKVCVGSDAMKKVIELKDSIIQSVASALTRLSETKDMSILDEAFKILCGEPITLTPPKDSAGGMHSKTPKKEMSPSYTEPCNDESVSEIEGTPTGRSSPIIVSRKARNAAVSDYREKKKCPNNWPTPKTKAVKLSFPGFSTPQGKTGKGKLRQMRFTTVKQTSVLNITNSTEIFGLKGTKDTRSMQLNMKRESLDDEDTIEPSPTSLTNNFSSIYKSSVRSSPLKLNKDSPNKIPKASPAKLSLARKPLNKLQIKSEDASECNTENVKNKLEHTNFKMEESINLLRPLRFRTPERSPAKLKDPDATECSIDSSTPLLNHVNKLENVSPDLKKIVRSPSKRPLAENINFTNLQPQCDTDSSMSLLNNPPIKTDLEKRNPAVEGIVKKDLERLKSKREDRVDAVFKEPTVRKKTEKMALPGWSCDECENFYAELYAHNPEMLARKMQECSRHRGRREPARPRTPPGFWQPRWDVPADTDEFNRRNDAV